MLFRFLRYSTNVVLYCIGFVCHQLTLFISHVRCIETLEKKRTSNDFYCIFATRLVMSALQYVNYHNTNKYTYLKSLQFETLAFSGS